MSKLLEIIKALDSSPQWVVLVHEKPDGDTLGSGSALVSLGERLGKRVIFGGRDEYPNQYDFLRGNTPYERFSCLPEDRLDADALVVCLDTSNLERSVPGVCNGSPHFKSVNIDHHVDNSLFADMNLLEPGASATGEIVTELLDASPWGITEYEANALYAAMVSDNGWFSYAPTTETSLRRAALLVRAGAQPWVIAREMNSNMREETLKLWGKAFSRVRTFAAGEAALFYLQPEDFIETETTQAATESLVNFLMRIKNVRLAALISSEEPSLCRVSLRARSPMNARDVAITFGGGGHDLAAGCRVAKGVVEALPEITSAMEKHIADRISINQ